jgi:succinate dehydrogenase / fumarate reductase cytochrome b subunit
VDSVARPLPLPFPVSLIEEPSVNPPSNSAPELPWLVRHEFLLRRLHSLSGLVPVGAYMCIHLLTNATVLDSAATFQENVYTIHSLGKILPLVEWGFIFLPLLFHAIFGVVIIRSGLPNTGNYPYAKNLRYTLQRVSGMIAMLFIFWHVFHMHGWFHSDAWLKNVAEPLNGARFRPYNAASSLALALQGGLVPVLYAIGILACVFHLANGIWTMGITWGVWVSKSAQRRADWICTAFGIGLAFVGLSALGGGRSLDVQDALKMEKAMYDSKVASQRLRPEVVEHKRWTAEEEKAAAERVQQQSEPAAAEGSNAASAEASGRSTVTAETATP